MKGSRIHSVVRELGNENIDVVQWTDDSIEMIKRALSPAKPLVVQLNEQLDPPRAKVVVQADEVSQAIGRGGINIRLASRLTGYEIDVYREISEEEEDIEIQEFADEIPDELLQMLRDIGCDTARAVLELSRDELMRRTGMEELHASHVLNVIKAEFADEEAAEGAAAAAATPDAEEETASAEEAVPAPAEEEAVATENTEPAESETEPDAAVADESTTKADDEPAAEETSAGKSTEAEEESETKTS